MLEYKITLFLHFLMVFCLAFTFLYGAAKEIIWLIFGFYDYQAS